VNADDLEAPAYSSESNKTMMDLGFGEEYGDTPTPAEWKECAGFQEEGKHGFIDFYQQDVVFPGTFCQTISKIYKNT